MIRERLIPVWRSEGSAGAAKRDVALPAVLAAGLATAFAAVFSWLSLARHSAYQSHAFDLGNMDQAVWNTLHGHFLGFTDMAVGNGVLTSRLAIHVEPLLAPLALFYLIHPGPETLLVVQAVVVAAGALPAYLLARAATGRDWLSLAFPIAYVLHPSLQNAVLDDFHAVTMSAAFLLWALYFLERNRPVPYAIFAALAMSTKEEVGLLVAGMGVWWLIRGRTLTGALSTLAGAGWFFVAVGIIIPHVNPSGRSPYLSRYGYLGHGLGGVVRGAITHPGRVMATLTSGQRLHYLNDLIHPLGFVPVVGAGVLVLAGPVLLINMLSSDATMYSGFYQYSAEIVPIVVASAALGIAWFARAGQRLCTPGADAAVRLLCGLVALASLVDARVYGFTPLSAGYLVPSAGRHQALEDRLLRSVPPEVPVAAADEIEPHLSDRRWVYLLPMVHPANGPAARYIVLDASIPATPFTPSGLRRVARRALQGGYGVLRARDGILILRMGQRTTRLPDSFYSFVYGPVSHATRVDARWGPLWLVGSVIHPRSGGVNRSRPAIGIETVWRTSAPLPAGARIVFRLSPVYSGAHPGLSPRWQTDADSPTWDWLPLPAWPAGRRIRAVSLPFLPPPDSWGEVDVAVTVTGLGRVGVVSGEATRIAPRTIRLGTVEVRP